MFPENAKYRIDRQELIALSGHCIGIQNEIRQILSKNRHPHHHRVLDLFFAGHIFSFVRELVLGSSRPPASNWRWNWTNEFANSNRVGAFTNSSGFPFLMVNINYFMANFIARTLNRSAGSGLHTE